ncbi:MAG: hypothetical protein KAU91_04060, partial [Candidatus Aminicenantes bacterium]|nr:hypothetical protein [Candidatus Aminicenantes bacterium]
MREKSKRTFVLLFLLPIVGGFAILSEYDSKKKGIVTYADGQVKRRPVEKEGWETAPVNTDILSGDKVRTYRRSRAELNLAQLDIIRLAPRTIIDIVRL